MAEIRRRAASRTVAAARRRRSRPRDNAGRAPGKPCGTRISSNVNTRMPDTTPIRDSDRRRPAGHHRRAAGCCSSTRATRSPPARSPGEALERLEAADFDLAILDLNYTRDTTSGQEGLRPDGADPRARSDAAGAGDDGVEQRRRRGRGDAARRARLHREAVGRREAAGDGADADRAAPRGARAASACRKRNQRLQRGATPPFIGDSPSIVEIRQTIERVAPSDAAVLITGEHGTGKEVVAAWLHAYSDRRAQAAGDDERRRPRRGHRRERAVRPREGRVHRRARRSHRLLRDGRRGHALPRRDRQHADAAAGQAAARAADRRVRARRHRRACATSTCGCCRRPTPTCTPRSPPDASAKICSTASTRSSSTCRRCASGKADIDALARHFLAHLRARATASRSPASNADALAAMQAHAWPGNVRELAHAIERAVLMADPAADGDRARDTCSLRPRAAASRRRPRTSRSRRPSASSSRRSLARHNGDVRLAAEQLGMSRSALYRRLQQYGVRD